MNDTHPTLAVAELMRLLMDEEGLGWDSAWEITTKTCAYTNHTIMAEALEKWPIEIFSRLLPRIYQIVEEINRRFIIEIQQKFPNDYQKAGSIWMSGWFFLNFASARCREADTKKYCCFKRSSLPWIWSSQEYAVCT